MKLNCWLFGLFFAFNWISVSAQTVSTLIDDPNKNFEAIHWHPDGRIYCADYQNGRLYQVSMDGTTQTVVTGIPNVAGGGFHSDGHFYFSGLSGGKIYRLESNNTATEIASGLDQPTGIATFTSDTLLVGQYGNSSIAKVCISTGSVTPWVSGNGLAGPDAVVSNGTNGYMVANFNNTQIHTVSTDGQINLFCNLPEPQALGYVIQAGNFWYCPTYTTRKIFRIDASGNAVHIAGTGSSGGDDGPPFSATFTRPNGICANPAGDTLLVSDNNRIRVITGFETIVSTETRPTETLDIQVFPNPAQDQVQVKVSGQQGQRFNWTLFDANGRVVDQGNLSTKDSTTFSIDLDHLPKGVYEFTIMGEQGLATTQSIAVL